MKFKVGDIVITYREGSWRERKVLEIDKDNKTYTIVNEHRGKFKVGRLYLENRYELKSEVIQRLPEEFV